MLAADKMLLQSRIRQNAIQLKEKEFGLHNENFGTVGTQAAVIAGFTMTALVEMTVPETTWRPLQFIYFNLIVVSLCCNIYCVGQTTTLAVCGTSLSLRGPDGSMLRAVDGMYAERLQVFRSFAVGLFTLLLAMTFASWIIMEMESALASTCILLYAMYQLYENSLRLYKRFRFDESQVISFDEMLRMTGGSTPQQEDNYSDDSQV